MCFASLSRCRDWKRSAFHFCMIIAFFFQLPCDNSNEINSSCYFCSLCWCLYCFSCWCLFVCTLLYDFFMDMRIILHAYLYKHGFQNICGCACVMVLERINTLFKTSYGNRNGSAGSVFGSLSCVMRCRGFNPPLSLQASNGWGWLGGGGEGHTMLPQQ